MDPLSDVLSLLKLETYVAGGFDLSGDWSIQFDAHEGIKCWALASGTCALLMEGAAEALPLKAGDCVLLPSGQRYRLASDLALTPIPFRDLGTIEWRGGGATLNGGGETMVLGGHFVLAGAPGEMLLGAMPAVIHLRDEDGRVGLRWALECMRQELSKAQPGGALVAQHLTHLILVQALRLYLSECAGRNVGWLFALADSQMAAAIGVIHADPGARWTLPTLARQAGMSRSSFAKKFKATVGASPIEYLTTWRMLLAGDRLRHTTEPVSAIALSLGYDSEAAFSTAFKRVMGRSPRQHARTHQGDTVLNLWGPASALHPGGSET
ncbi:MAG: AraC family transcriptional regulator [Brevundimonas sp.]